MKVYVLEVNYDYETSHIAGVFSNKDEAEEVAKQYEKSDMVLDGCCVMEYTLDEQ